MGNTWKGLCELSSTPLKWHSSHYNKKRNDTYGMPPGPNTVVVKVLSSVSLVHLKIQKNKAYFSHVEVRNLKNREVNLAKVPRHKCGRAVWKEGWSSAGPVALLLCRERLSPRVFEWQGQFDSVTGKKWEVSISLCPQLLSVVTHPSPFHPGCPEALCRLHAGQQWYCLCPTTWTLLCPPAGNPPEAQVFKTLSSIISNFKVPSKSTFHWESF